MWWIIITVTLLFTGTHCKDLLKLASDSAKNTDCENFTYHGSPPAYINEYRQSKSRYDKLLTGLALYNLERNIVDNEETDMQLNCLMTVLETIADKNYILRSIDCKLLSSFFYEEGTKVDDEAFLIISTNYTRDGDEKVMNAEDDKGISIDASNKYCMTAKQFSNLSMVVVGVECWVLEKFADCLAKDNSHMNIL